MDNNDTNEVVEQTSAPEEVELSHSDKMIGILSEPSKTFESLSKFPLKTIDWLLPIFLLLLFVAVSRIIVLNNDEIKFDVKQKQIAKIEEGLQKSVEDGTLTQQEADQRLDTIHEQMDKFGGTIGTVIQTVSIFIVGFIIFFITTGIYYLFVKFLLKGEGTYNSALVVNGLTAYIGIITVIVAAILSLVFSRMFNDVSIAAFMNADKSTILGFILGKLDIITIWAYIVLSVGFAKMFKSASTGKYYGLVFGLWIIGSFILFLLSKSFPFLNFG
ncbi:MAG: YIP1 family protein [Bacteroidetes bacterium]|nr:YIP1 family protein [Bacteroidota bacterium]